MSTPVHIHNTIPQTLGTSSVVYSSSVAHPTAFGGVTRTSVAGIHPRVSVQTPHGAVTRIGGASYIGGAGYVGRSSIVNRGHVGVTGVTTTTTGVTHVSPQRFIEERYVGERVVNITENRLEERVIATQAPAIHTHVNTVTTYEDEPIIQERIVEKQIEVIVERKVAVERFVDVPYDVIVERPIEKVIEKEIEIEKLIDCPYERIVEVPVERIVDVPYERIVHKPVEVLKNVERPYETIVERKVEEPWENIVYHDNQVDCLVENLHQYPGAHHLPTEVIVHEQERIVERPIYIDNIIEQVVDIPIERIIEVPVERIVEKPIEHIIEKPIYIDNIIEREVQIPVEHIVEHPVEHIVERPVYIDNIIERPIPIEVIREEVIQVPVEHIVEHPVYIDNIIEKPVEVIIENPVPVEKIIEIPIAQHIETHIAVEEVFAQPANVVAEVPVPIESVRRLPIEYVVRRDNAIPIESIIEVSVPVPRKDVHERIIERPVEWERIVQKPVPVEKIVEVEVERVTENAIYREEIREIPIPFDRIIEQKFEVIVQNIVEVPVEKIITVPIRTISQNPVETRNYFENDVVVNSTVVQPVPGMETEEHFEVMDPLLAEKTIHNVNQINAIATENSRLQAEAHSLNVDHTPAFNNCVAHNAQLKSELSELESRLNIIEKDRERLVHSINGKTVQHINYTVPDPSHVPLRHALEGEISENKRLVSQAVSHGNHNVVVNAPAQFVNAPSQFVNAPAHFVNGPSQFINRQAPAHFVNGPAPFVNRPASFVNTPAHIYNGVRTSVAPITRASVSPVVTTPGPVVRSPVLA